MERKKDSILAKLRLANFNRAPLRIRLALLFELNEIGVSNEDDIVAHVTKRLIEMCEEIDKIRQISEDNAENHAADIEELYKDFKHYSQHSVTKNFYQEFDAIYNDLYPLCVLVIGAKEDKKLEELRHRFEQVPPVDWNSSDWLKNANRNLADYQKFQQETERTWQVRSEQADKLKFEIENAANIIRTEVMRHT